MRALSALIKPASGSCNMRCGYCFYADIAGKREVKNRGIMRLDTLEHIVRNAFAETTRMAAFAFQGGEPTLAGLDFFREFIRLEKLYNTKKIPTVRTLQTNGALINEEWAAFLAENNFLTGLSIDGPKAVHDALRPDASGNGTHGICMTAARLLNRAGAEFNILTVVTQQLAAQPEPAYRFYRQRHLDFIQFIPCLDSLDGEPGMDLYSPSPKVYGEFLCRVFDLWYEDFVKGRYVSVRAFDNYIHILAGHPHESCAVGGACTAYALIEADGSVYPCDFYATDEYLLGNVTTHSFGEMIGGDRAREFIGESLPIPNECGECPYYFICQNGCRRDRKLRGGAEPINRWCEAYKFFFAHALPRMKRIASLLFMNSFRP